jgi:hypothetical protein
MCPSKSFASILASFKAAVVPLSVVAITVTLSGEFKLDL